MNKLEQEFLKNKDKEKDASRLSMIVQDFTDAYEKLHSIPPAISIFGSARVKEDDKYYQKACELSQILSDKGFAIITGGGGGIMEAANKGAKISVGLRIKLPKERSNNPFITIPLHFQYFFTRKVSFLKYSVGFIVMPGGFGTLDELSEALCLVQTEKMGNFPIILFGKSFYEPLEAFFKEMLKHHYIKKEDLTSYIITDSVEEAIEYIEKYNLTRMLNKD